jgi:hypothetical protein
MKEIFKKFWNRLKNDSSELATSKEVSNDEIISFYHKMKDEWRLIPVDEPNYELAKKVFLDFNDFNLKNTENQLMMYLDFVPKSLLPYPQNYIKCAYYVFLEKLKKEKNLKMFKNVQEIGCLLFYNYPDYKKYKENIKKKKFIDTALKDLNLRETFKKLYGVYEISEEDYNSSPSAIDSTDERLLYDFGILPEIEEDVDVGKIMEESKKQNSTKITPKDE